MTTDANPARLSAGVSPAIRDGTIARKPRSSRSNTPTARPVIAAAGPGSAYRRCAHSLGSTATRSSIGINTGRHGAAASGDGSAARVAAAADDVRRANRSVLSSRGLTTQPLQRRTVCFSTYVLLNVYRSPARTRSVHRGVPLPNSGSLGSTG